MCQNYHSRINIQIVFILLSNYNDLSRVVRGYIDFESRQLNKKNDDDFVLM